MWLIVDYALLVRFPLERHLVWFQLCGLFHFWWQVLGLIFNNHGTVCACVVCYCWACFCCLPCSVVHEGLVVWACLDQNSADGADKVGMAVPCMWASWAWGQVDVRRSVFLRLKAFFAVVVMVSGSFVRFIDVSRWAFVHCLLAAGWACLNGMFPVRVVTLAACFWAIGGSPCRISVRAV